MSAATAASAGRRRLDIARWRRRSRTIRRLRVLLPVLIGAIFLSLGGMVGYNAAVSRAAEPQEGDAPIRLINPRFAGRDDKGRAFVLTAASAVRDKNDYQRVLLELPALVLDETGPDALRLGSATGVYHEGNRKLELTGGVRIAGARAAFDTAASLFDTKTGEVVGSGPIHGSGSLGEISAKSYGVYGKGDRIIFKGGVHTRMEQE
jgi:lipopolysaccharide export system protein LptC